MALPTETTQNDVITTLTDALLLLPGLAGVAVNSAPLDLGNVSTDMVAVLNIADGNESWYGLGNARRLESYSLQMACLSFEPGASESAIRACRDRAYAIHNAVAGYIRSNPHISGVTIKQLSGTNLDQGYDAQARWARLEWLVRVNAQLAVT